MSATTNQWMHQFYNMQQSLIEGSSSSFSDSTVMSTATTTTTSTHHHLIATNNIMQSSSSESILSPKGNVSKPIRRRSRASKRTPTTLLNANTTNFRALVQQFTGCSSTPTMSSSSLIGVHKGPITLDFQQGSKNHQTQYTNFGGTRGYDDQIQQQHVVVPIPRTWHQKEQDQVAQEQIGGYSFDPNQGNMEVSHGLIMDNDFSLHDLTVNAFPNDTYYKNQ